MISQKSKKGNSLVIYTKRRQSSKIPTKSFLFILIDIFLQEFQIKNSDYNPEEILNDKLRS